MRGLLYRELEHGTDRKMGEDGPSSTWAGRGHGLVASGHSGRGTEALQQARSARQGREGDFESRPSSARVHWDQAEAHAAGTGRAHETRWDGAGARD